MVVKLAVLAPKATKVGNGCMKRRYDKPRVDLAPVKLQAVTASSISVQQ